VAPIVNPSPSPRSSLRVLVRIVSAILVVVSLYALREGLGYLWMAHLSASEFSFSYDYATRGGLVCAIAIFVLLIALYSAVRRSGFGLLLILGFLALGFASGDLEHKPDFEMKISSAKCLHDADFSLKDWGAQHGRFPADCASFEQAIPLHTDVPAWQRPTYFRGGAAVPYRCVFRAFASEDDFRSQLPAQPAAFLYSVSPDGKQYRLALTLLAEPVSNEVVLHGVLSGQLSN